MSATTFSSAEQLIIAAFKTAAVADLAQARSWVAAVETSTGKTDALIDYVLDESSADARALWLDAWSLGDETSRWRPRPTR